MQAIGAKLHCTCGSIEPRGGEGEGGGGGGGKRSKLAESGRRMRDRIRAGSLSVRYERDIGKRVSQLRSTRSSANDVRSTLTSSLSRDFRDVFPILPVDLPRSERHGSIHLGMVP